MYEPLEQDDVDEVVGGITPDAQSRVEMLATIAALRHSPDYPAQLARAAAILADIAVDFPSFGEENSQELLDQWQQRIAEMAGGGSHPAQFDRPESREVAGGR